MSKFASSALIATAGCSLFVSPALAARPVEPKIVRAVAAGSADPAKLSEARAIISVMFPVSERQATLDKIMINLLKPMRAQLSLDRVTDPGLRELFNGAMSKMLDGSRSISSNHFPAALEAMATAYTHEFTLEELKQYRAFAATPAGAHYLHASIGMIGDPAVQKANSALMVDIQALQKSTFNELIPKITAYVKAHPETDSQLQPKSVS